MPEEVTTGEHMTDMAEFSNEETPYITDAAVGAAAPETDVTTPPPDDGTPVPSAEADGEGEGSPEPEPDPELEAIKSDAEFAKAIRDRINSLPDDQREAALVALGLAEPSATKIDLADYEPAGPIEEAIAPHLDSIAALPKFQTDVQEAFDRHAELLDTVVIENAYLREIVEAMAQAQEYEMPSFDAADIRKQAYAGKNYKELVKAAAKPAAAKAAAVKAQNAKKKPDAVGAASASNGSDINSTKLRDFFALSG